MLEFKIGNGEMTFESEKYYSKILFEKKPFGELTGGGMRMRAEVMPTFQVKGTGKELNLRGNWYWNGESLKIHSILTGGSLQNFIKDHGIDYKEFKEEFWDKVKRLSTNIFSESDIREYRKAMKSEVEITENV